MRTNGWVKVGMAIAEGDAHAAYYREVLEHAGFRAEILTDLADFEHYDVIVLAGEGSLNSGQQNHMLAWVQEGGKLVLSGSAWGLAETLGLNGENHISNGLLNLDGPGDRTWPDFCGDIRFFSGKTYSYADGWHTIARCEGKSALMRKAHGEGWIWFLGPNLGHTFALMQLGRAVECDAIGPNELTARLDDGILRAEDGIALSFEHDRAKAEGADSSFFAFPHADALKDVFIRCLVEAVESTGHRFAMTWMWPGLAPGGAILSMDCETSDFDALSRLQRTLTMFGMRATLSVAMPGYPADAYRQIKSWGHEVGFLYQTDNGAGWHQEKLGIQWTALARLSGNGSMISARPVDGRWRGYLNFYDLCQTAGARVSMGKGGRQAGTQGFAFGTCHPFFPLKKDGAPYLVMEIPSLVYMPGETTPDSVSDAILAQTALRNGCFHLIFRPEAIDHPEANAAMRRTLSLAKQQRFEFMTAEEVHTFEKARRHLKFFAKGIGDEISLTVAAESDIREVTVLITGPRFEAESRGREMLVTPVNRWGTTFYAVTLSLESKQSVELMLNPTTLTQAA